MVDILLKTSIVITAIDLLPLYTMGGVEEIGYTAYCPLLNTICIEKKNYDIEMRTQSAQLHVVLLNNYIHL